jgi:hypothetical protein
VKAPRWRPQDEALLLRLEDEARFDQLWRERVPGTARPPSPRAAGLVSAFRERGVEGEALRGILEDPPLADLPPRLCHHLALFDDRVADLREAAADGPGALEARVRALAAWVRLASERRYLEDLFDRVTGTAFRPSERGPALERVLTLPVRRLVERASGAARDERTRSALRALARMEEAVTRAGVDGPLAERFSREAESARGRILDEALAPVAASLEEAEGRAPDGPAVARLLEQATALWRFADRDELVERFLVQRSIPHLWRLYKLERWEDLTRALDPLIEPSEHLARRIVGDATRVAYAAPCAQIHVFRAETSLTHAGRMRLAERALEICPTHRNGRAILASALVDRAHRALDRAAPWATGDAMTAAARDLVRAQELFPLSRRLPAAKARLKAMGRDIDA